MRSKLCRPLGWGVPGREVSDYKDLGWSVLESGRKSKKVRVAKMQQTKSGRQRVQRERERVTS